MDEAQLAYALLLAGVLKELAVEAVKCNITLNRVIIYCEDSEEPFTMEAEGDNTFYLSPGWPD